MAKPVFVGDWPYTKTFIEGIVYYLELLLPFHVTANRTRVNEFDRIWPLT